MAQTITQKLRIKEGTKLLTFNAPSNFVEQLSPLPDGVNISTVSDDYDQLHWFVTSTTQFNSQIDWIIGLIKTGVVCWIYYPKGTSGIQTDLTRDKGWEKLETYNGVQYLSLVSFDATWSAFGIKIENAVKPKKISQQKESPLASYIDSKTRVITLPPEIENAFAAEPKAAAAFNALSFTNRKEYVEWVVTAKRPETKAERLTCTIERLLKGWKNPRNI